MYIYSFNLFNVKNDHKVDHLVWFTAQVAHFTPHQDMVTSLEMCVRNERTLILSASSDCSVGLWDIYGNQIGTFGQVGAQYSFA